MRKEECKITIVWAPGPTLIHKTQDPTAASAPLYLSKFLEKRGFNSVVIDGSLLFPEQDIKNDIYGALKQLVSLIEKTEPDFLCVGGWSSNIAHAEYITRLYKAKHPDVTIILGGYNPTFLPEKTLNLMPHIDFLVRGEGEVTLFELITCLITDKKPNKVNGISFFKDGKIMHTPNREQITDLDTLPFIDLEPLYKKPKNMGMPVFFSRGCNYGCSYCSICCMWGKTRYFSTDYIIKQLKHLYTLYGGDVKLRYDSDNFFTRIDIAKEVATRMKEEFSEIKWHALARIDHINRERIEFFTKKGMCSIFIGLESNIPETLRFLNKTPDPGPYITAINKSVDILKNTELKSEFSFMYGAPNETETDFQTLNGLLRELKEVDNFVLFGGPITLYPGTLLWDKFVNGELEIYRKPRTSEVVLSEIAFSTKFNNLVWMAPNEYRIKSKVLSSEQLENCLMQTQNIIHGR